MIYGEMRKQIQTGDVLLFSGTRLVSRLFRWGSHSKYSHAGLAAWWEDRLFVFEAEATGIRIDRASMCVDRYEGGVDWFAPTVPVDRVKVHREALDQLGKPFGYTGLAKLAWVTLTKGRAVGEDGVVPVAAFCSQYVSLCYRAGGIDLAPTSDAETTPGQIAESKFLEFKGTLR